MLLVGVDSAGPGSGAQGVFFVHEFADLAENIGVVHRWPSHFMIRSGTATVLRSDHGRPRKTRMRLATAKCVVPPEITWQPIGNGEVNVKLTAFPPRPLEVMATGLWYFARREQGLHH